MASTASALANQLRDEFLTCSLCFSSYKNPKLLSCQHSFCRECLDRWIVSSKVKLLACPVCRKESVIPVNGAIGFSASILITNLLEYLRTNVKDERERKTGFLFQFGEKGSSDGQLYKPQSVAMVGKDRVIVADSKNRLQIFSRYGKYKDTITLSSLDKKCVPRCLAVATSTGEGVVYVSDMNNKRVWGCNLKGEIVKEIGKDNLSMPSGVAISSEGNIHVVDVWSHSVRSFVEGEHVPRRVGGLGDGESGLCQPTHIAVNKCGELVVADTHNNRIQIFDSYGRCVRRFGRKGVGDGEFLCPSGIAIDRFGNIIVADSSARRIQMFTYWGRFIRRIDKDGDGLKYPEGVSIAGDGAVYVADAGSHSVKVFQY